jgi:hypothetical protein
LVERRSASFFSRLRALQCEAGVKLSEALHFLIEAYAFCIKIPFSAST